MEDSCINGLVPIIFGKVAIEMSDFGKEAKIMVSVREFCRISGLSDQQVRRLTHVNGFPMIRAGWKILIHRERAVEWLADFAGRPEALAVK